MLHSQINIINSGGLLPRVSDLEQLAEVTSAATFTAQMALSSPGSSTGFDGASTAACSGVADSSMRPSSPSCGAGARSSTSSSVSGVIGCGSPSTAFAIPLATDDYYRGAVTSDVQLAVPPVLAAPAPLPSIPEIISAQPLLAAASHSPVIPGVVLHAIAAVIRLGIHMSDRGPCPSTALGVALVHNRLWPLPTFDAAALMEAVERGGGSIVGQASNIRGAQHTLPLALAAFGGPWLTLRGSADGETWIYLTCRLMDFSGTHPVVGSRSDVPPSLFRRPHGVELSNYSKRATSRTPALYTMPIPNRATAVKIPTSTTATIAASESVPAVTGQRTASGNTGQLSSISDMASLGVARAAAIRATVAKLADVLADGPVELAAVPERRHAQGPGVQRPRVRANELR